MGSRIRSRRSSPVACVDDPDVEVLDEQDDAGSGVGSSDADVVQPAVVAEAEFAAGVDDIVADAWLGFGLA